MAPARLGSEQGEIMAARFFSDILAEISQRGRRLISGSHEAASAREITEQADALLSGRGEASGVALAREILDCFEALDEKEKSAFFTELATRFGADRDVLDDAAKAYLTSHGDDAVQALRAACEGGRPELIRRLNLAPGGMAGLVAMRAELLHRLPKMPGLRAVDADFEHLFTAWFNRGFLVLRRIDWDTPASILERIVRYEAVHAIRDWNDLRNRIDRPDRRLYAFFHPALSAEPLIFVEVALSRDIPESIAEILDSKSEPIDPAKADTATFYSISNCQAGLRGISFGNFLIKQVVEELSREFPGLRNFVTLSPVPGFRAWLEAVRGDDSDAASPMAAEACEMLAGPDWREDPALHEKLRGMLMPLAAHYFVNARNKEGRPVDAVARFHLGNGARLERLNWLGDPSPKGLKQSAGLMVNYLYVPKDIEKNHEAYANDSSVVAAPAIAKQARTVERQQVRQAVQ
jgi:malonyl-CoA decarboxylase